MCDSYAPPIEAAGEALEGSEVYRNFYFLAFVQSLIAKCRGTRRIPVWQRALAVSTALALLVSLLWLVPRQGRQDSPATQSQSMPGQDSDHTAEETARPTLPPLASPTAASAVPGQVSEASTAHREDALQSPVLPLEKSEASGAAPALQDHTPTISEEPAEVLDAQAMQEFITRLDAARGIPGEHLDTKAMDHLLARLESPDKTTLPTATRSKMARKKGAKSLRRAAPGRGTPGSAPPPRSAPVPLSSALASQFPDAPRPIRDALP